MADNQNNNQNLNRAAQLAKQPTVFTLKQSFPVWFKQFRNYAELLQVPNEHRYRTLLSFLDAESFTIVENLALNQEQRADVFQAAPYQLIRNALTQRESRIPPGYELKYRKQRENESIEKYASELECLALEAFPGEANIRQNRTLIESFISGIRNDELAIKLLEENFQNLGQAIERAVHYYQALQTRRFIKTESDFRPSLEKVYNVSKNIDSEEKKPAKEQDVNAVNASPTEQSQSHYNQKSQPNINMPAPAPANLQFSGHAHYNRMFLQNPNQATWGNQQYFNEPMKHPFAGPDWPSQPANNQNWQQYPPWLNNQRFLNMPRPQNMTRRSKPNVVCYHCGKIGHYKNECYSLQRIQQSQNTKRDAKNCTYCGKSGHLSHNCWHLNGKNTQPSNQMSNLNPFRPT